MGREWIAAVLDRAVRLHTAVWPEQPDQGLWRCGLMENKGMPWINRPGVDGPMTVVSGIC
jgi:hypothetical protein